MDNIQLAVFLENIVYRLEIAISSAENQLPHDIERAPVEVYTGNHIFPALDIKHWKTRSVGTPFALIGLFDLQASLQHQVELLKKGGES